MTTLTKANASSAVLKCWGFTKLRGSTLIVIDRSARSRFQMGFESRASESVEDDESVSCSIHQKQGRQRARKTEKPPEARWHHVRPLSKLRTRVSGLKAQASVLV